MMGKTTKASVSRTLAKHEAIVTVEVLLLLSKVDSGQMKRHIWRWRQKGLRQMMVSMITVLELLDPTANYSVYLKYKHEFK